MFYDITNIKSYMFIPFETEPVKHKNHKNLEDTPATTQLADKSYWR